MNTYLELMQSFIKIGAFTFGGGYAMLPLLQKEIVDKHHWATEEEIMDYFAVGQCTPGIIAVNTATFIGYNLKGIPGAIIATLSIIFPSIIIIISIASILSNFSELAIVKHALAGIRIAVCVLVFHAVVKLIKTGIKDWMGIGLFLLAFILTFFNFMPTVLIIVDSALFGVFYQTIKTKKRNTL